MDQYFVILENIGEQFDELENQLLEKPDKRLLNQLHHLRREIFNLRRSVYPLREVVGKYEKIGEPTVKVDSLVFIRDLYDHTIQVIESVEIFREMATGILDLYMNSMSQPMNEIMKVLTIIATIFIPLTFLAGVYGMNFTFMPELEYKYAYFIVIGIMAVSVLGMLWYFRRKQWT